MRKDKLIALLTSIMILSSVTGVFAACKSEDSSSSSSVGSDSSVTSSSDSTVSESSSESSSDESSVKVEYTVTFDCVGGSEIEAQTIEKGAKVAKPMDPTREGYTFVEWQLDGLTYDFDSAVTGSITLVAVWQKDALKTFTVSFDVGEGTPVDDKLITEGGTVVEPTSALEGKYIDGWTLNGEAYDFNTPITGDITLVAVWKVGSLSLEFATGGEIVSIGDEAKLNALTDIDATVTLESSNTDVISVAQDGTLTIVGAGYAEITATVKSLRVTQGICVLGDAISEDDLYMVKWSNADSSDYTITDENGILSLSTIFAQWDNKTGIVWEFSQPKAYYQLLADKGYCIAFNISIAGANAEEWRELRIYGQTLDNYGLSGLSGIIQIPLSTMIEKYERACVLGQSGSAAESSDFKNFFITCGYSDKISRHFEINISGFDLREVGYETKTVSFDTDGGSSINSISVIEGTCLTALPVPTKEGYIFNGWTLNEETYAVGTTVNEDVTLTATWREPSFHISFATGSGNVLGTIGATSQLVVDSTEPVVWSTSDETVATVDENGLVTAVADGLVEITATIGNESVIKTLVVENMTLTSDQIKRIAWNWNDTLTVTETAEGYTFAKTFEAGNYTRGIWLDWTQPKAYYELLAEAGYVMAFDITVGGEEAYNWNLVKVYGKTLGERGLASESGTVYVDMADIVAAYDMLANFRSVPWNGGNALNGIASVSDYFLSLDRVNDYARKYEFTVGNFRIEKAPAKHTVTFETGEGSAVDALIVTEGATIEAPDTTREGYAVKHWTLDGEIYDFTTPVSSDITLVAVWEVYDFAAKDFKFRQWGWNHKDVVPTEENGVIAMTVAFEKWDNKTGVLWQMPWSKAYYEALDAAGYDLYFDISVSGVSADQWQRLRVYGVHLEDYGVQNGQGTIKVDIATLLAKYDRVAALKGGEEALSSDFSAFFLTCDYSETIKTEVTITISNIKFKSTATLNLAFAEDSKDVIAKSATTTLVATVLNCDVSEVVWSSSDETVATVANGVVTGVKGGMAVITATAGDLSASKTVYVASADLKASDFNRMSWNWNQTNPAVTEVENGYTIDATFGVGAAGVGYWVKLAQEKAYYEKLAEEGYSLTFDLTVGGEEAWNWKIVKIFGKTLEELGFTDKNGKVTISMDALVAAYDIQADLASKEMTDVAQSNYWFTIDRVNDYARAYTFTITNYEFIKVGG